jgi:hypothetical protein
MFAFEQTGIKPMFKTEFRGEPYVCPPNKNRYQTNVQDQQFSTLV